MKQDMTRRRMLAASAALGGMGFASRKAVAAPYETKLKKALILRDFDAEALRKQVAAGFEGVELWAWDVDESVAADRRKEAETIGTDIHSIIRAWTDFNHPDKLEEHVKSVERALYAARGYGASDVLLVPCRLTDVKMPEAWEFNVEFDEKTGHVTKVVDGDNAPFAEYIAEQNRATEVSREALKRLAPVAEETGVHIGIENVWNNLWVTPELSKNFVQSVDSPWVQYYFDIGNHVKYGKPEHWISVLGDMIIRMHVKDFRLNENGQGGEFVDIRDGSVDWPAVREAIERIGYNGWMTIEGSGGLPYEEQNKRLEDIIAGR